MVSPVVAASAGAYTVAVSNAGGTTTSSSATLTVMEPPVSLAISKMGTNVVISWPQTCSTYTLEATGMFTPPSSTWAPVGVAPTAGGGNWMDTVAIAGTNAFFRLRNP